MLTVSRTTTEENDRGVPATVRPTLRASALTDGKAGSMRVAERFSLAPPAGQGRNSKATVSGERLITQDPRERHSARRPATSDVDVLRKVGCEHTTTRSQTIQRGKHLDSVDVASLHRVEPSIVRSTTKARRYVKETNRASDNALAISY